MKQAQLSAIIAFCLLGVSACSLMDSDGQKRVRYVLKDGASAEFRNEKKGVSKDGKDKDRLLFCGEVNSKNGYGAMGGFEKYVVIDKLVVMQVSGSRIFDKKESSDNDAVYQSQMFNSRFELEILDLQVSNEKLSERRRVLSNDLPSDAVRGVTAFDLVWSKYCG